MLLYAVLSYLFIETKNICGYIRENIVKYNWKKIFTKEDIL